MGYLGTPGRSSYAAAKHALHGYFDSLRAEVWREGLRVTIVCPGYVNTAISAHAVGPRGESRGGTEATHRRASRRKNAPPRSCAARRAGGRRFSSVAGKSPAST